MSRIFTYAAVLLTALIVSGGTAHAQRTHHGYPAYWVREAACIRHYESHSEWHINTGNGFYGAYQFMLSTWRAHAPASWTDRPDLASPPRQTFVAWRTWIANGRRWGGRQWPNTAKACGVY
jgi:hypothetical protein